MAKKFYVWADANCNGEDIEWIELTGIEYFEFRKNPANKNRFIIRLTDHYSFESDVIFIECTQTQYKEWREEYLHSLYIRKEQGDVVSVSLDELFETPGFDIPSAIDVETEVINASFYDDLLGLADFLGDKEKTIFEIFTKVKMFDVPLPMVIKDYEVSERTYYRKIPQILEKVKKVGRITGFYSALT